MGRQIREGEQSAGGTGGGHGTWRGQRAAQARRTRRRHGHAPGYVRHRRRREPRLDPAVATHPDPVDSRPGRVVCPPWHQAPRPGRGLRDLSGRRVPQLLRTDVARGDTRADEREHADGDRRRVHQAAGCRRSAHRRRPLLAGRPRPRRAGHRLRGGHRHRRPGSRPGPLPAPPGRPGGHHALVRYHPHARRGGALAPQPVRGRPGGPADRAAAARPGARDVRVPAGAHGRRHHHERGALQRVRAAVPVGAGRRVRAAAARSSSTPSSGGGRPRCTASPSPGPNWPATT